jgi:hypothetical protein
MPTGRQPRRMKPTSKQTSERPSQVGALAHKTNSLREFLRDKELAMKYEKPEIVALGTACTAVQGVSKPGIPLDNMHRPTTPAYEADE